MSNTSLVTLQLLLLSKINCTCVAEQQIKVACFFLVATFLSKSFLIHTLCSWLPAQNTFKGFPKFSLPKLIINSSRKLQTVSTIFQTGRLVFPLAGLTKHSHDAFSRYNMILLLETCGYFEPREFISVPSVTYIETRRRIKGISRILLMVLCTMYSSVGASIGEINVWWFAWR